MVSLVFLFLVTRLRYRSYFINFEDYETVEGLESDPDPDDWDLE